MSDHGRRIVSTPGVCGGDARVDGTRIPVWSIENWRRLGMTEAEMLENYPTLRLGDLHNAWAYAKANRAEIERAIWENEHDDDDG